jgi:short-subunit dehydrogenase involved in D-alanine esterification of teichoic acids
MPDSEQTEEAKDGFRIVELMPPAVQTELHDAKHQPDLKGGSAIGMPLEQFTEEAFQRLAARKEDQISVQPVPGLLDMEKWRGETALKMAKMMAGRK